MDENAHLYLWVTNNFLEDGLKVMRELGFRYITNIVWKKDRIGLGQYFRGQHELCLFGVKGRLPYKHQVSATRSSCTESTVIEAPRRKHSQKPDEMYGKIENTSYPPYVEIFAREEREGWDSWGDEVPDWTPPYVQEKIIS